MDVRSVLDTSQRRRQGVLVVAPHPDDEALGCGGTIAARCAAGHTVAIVFMTDGERAFAEVLGIHEHPTPKELAAIRRREAHAAAAALGVPASCLYRLGLPDSGLADVAEEALRALAQVVDGLARVDELFAPHPADGHPDHRATWGIVEAALDRLVVTPRVCHYLIWRESQRLTPPQAAIDVSLHLSQKQEAIRAYRSQTTCIAPGQRHPVLPGSFVAPFAEASIERFWLRQPR